MAQRQDREPPWMRLAAESIGRVERHIDKYEPGPVRDLLLRHVAYMRRVIADDRARLLNLSRRHGDK